VTTKAGGRTTATPQGTAAASLADTPAPSSREELLVAHEAARRRRNAAPLGGHDWEAASAEVGRIEIEIARLERTMDPPRV
jgi:hypothetical protein